MMTQDAELTAKYGATPAKRLDGILQGMSGDLCRVIRNAHEVVGAYRHALLIKKLGFLLPPYHTPPPRTYVIKIPAQLGGLKPMFQKMTSRPKIK